MFVLTFSPLGEKVNTNMALIHRQVKKSTLGKIVNNHPYTHINTITQLPSFSRAVPVFQRKFNCFKYFDALKSFSLLNANAFLDPETEADFQRRLLCVFS